MMEMKKGFIVLAVLMLIISSGTAHANLVTVNFDDLATSTPFNAGGSVGTVYYDVVPTNYTGLTWIGWEVIGNSDVNKYGNTLIFPSQANAVYPGNGSNAITSNGQAFNFMGAYFASFVGGNGAGSSLILEGFLNGQSQGSVNVPLTGQMVYNSVNFGNVDEVRFTDGYFLMDNFKYDTTPVPIPATVWLFGSGLAGLLGLGRKKKG